MDLPDRIVLRDLGEPLVSAWRDAFADIDGVVPGAGDFFDEPADAMVSPANSFGIMDGGLDLAIRYELEGIEERVRARIAERHLGELPVGAAEIVDTDDSRWPYLVCAPTMRVPMDIADTINPYLAFRAVLLAIGHHNAAAASRRIASVVVPGLGTGIGRVTPRRCARLMRLAFDSVATPDRRPTPATIRSVTRALDDA